MRLIKQSILPLLCGLSLALIGYMLGWYVGAKTVFENGTALNLAQDVTNFNLLEEGKIDQTKSKLGFSIINDVQWYDSCQKDNPNFGAKI